MMRVLLVIPAYNEAKFIGKLLQKTLRYFEPQDILVIDDGSQDATFEIAKSFGVKVLKNAKNLGKGRSLEKGFVYAVQNGYDAVITMDADLQHDPDELPKFLKAAESFDFVIGSRWQGLSLMPWDRYMSNRLTTLILSAIAGVKVEDTQSGYRLIKTKVLRKVRPKSAHYDAESEYVVLVARAGFKIGNVPIKTIYGEEESSVNKVLDTLRFLKLVLKLIFAPQ